MFQKAASGDHEIFARYLLSIDYLNEGEMSELLYGTEIRSWHTRNFSQTFKRLLQLAAGCGVDGIITDSLRQSAFGLLCQRMKLHAPANGSAGGSL